MRFGLQLWSQSTDWPAFRDAALAAEANGLGLDLDLGPPAGDLRSVGAAHLRGLDGHGRPGPSRRGVRLGLMVGANTFRNPGLTAKLADTLDHVSGGRAVLGIGGAWFEREHDAFGIDFGASAGRATRLARRGGGAHAPAARRRAVLPRRAVSTGSHDALYAPRPVQAHLPILIGGSGPPQDAPDGGRARGRLEHVRHARGGHATRSRRSPSHAPTSAATSRRSRRPSAFRSSSTTTPRRPAADGRPDRRERRRRPWAAARTWWGRRPRSPTPSGRTATSASRRSSSGCRRRMTTRRSSGCARSGPPRPMRVVELAGGVGGAKLAEGLAAHLGTDADRRRQHRRRRRTARLLVMPDHDTVLYTLAGRFDDERGWGLEGETWAVDGCSSATARTTWFRLGDRDLATHLAPHARRLRAGAHAHRGRPSVCRRPRRPRHRPADVRPARPHRILDRRRLARVPGVLRAPPPGARGPRGPLTRRSRPRARRAGVLDGDRRRRRDRHRPVEPDRVDRPDPRRPRHARASPAARAPGVPVVAVSPIVGGAGAQGPADRMLAVARPRVERPAGSRACYAGLVDVFVLDAVDVRRARPSPPSACARSSPTRSWPTTAVAHASRPSGARVIAAARWSRPPMTADGPRGRRDRPRRAARGGQDAARRITRRRGATRSGRTAAAPRRSARPWRVDRLADVLVVSPDREVLARASTGRPDAATANGGPQRRRA